MTRQQFDRLLNEYVYALTVSQLAHDRESEVTAAVIEGARHNVVEAREALWKAINGTSGG